MPQGGYLETRRSPAAIGAVVALHVGIAAAVLLMPGVVIRSVMPPPLVIREIPEPKDPPLRREPPKQRTTPAQRASEPPIDQVTRIVPTDAGTGPIILPPPPLPPEGHGPIIAPPPPPPAVLIEPRIDPRYAGAFQPAYPQRLMRQEIEGRVTVRVLIGTDGRVKALEPVSATDPLFLEATRRQALDHWRFLPATRDGVAVESWRTMSVRFEMNA